MKNVRNKIQRYFIILLLYGLDKAFLYEKPKLYNCSQKLLYKLCKEKGILVYQAHPFRSYCKPQNPDYLDGIEVFNGNPNHDSQNALAKAFALKHKHLKWVSGSDYHQAGACARGGIRINTTLANEKELVQYLSKNEVEIIEC